MQYRLLLPLLLLLTIRGFGQDIQPSYSGNFSTTNELQTDSVWVVLQNQGNKTAHINGVRSWWRFGGEVCWVKDSIFSIAAGGQHGLYVYFRPTHNIAYQLPLVLLTDSHYGAIPLQLQGQGTFSKTYYNSTQNLEGQTLKQQFSSLLAQNYQAYSYNTARDEMYADLDNVNGDVTCVYTGRTATFNTRSGATANNMNCEHTMPQSLFGSASPMQTDIHHLFPSDAVANSVRSNNPFGPVNNPTWSVGGSKYGGGIFEPRDAHKGNAARALLYFALRYGDYSNFIAGMESTLRSWHLQDQPDAFERGRNDGIFQLQNNRNPLVDYPQFEERLASFTGNANLTPSSQWAAYPDTLWISNGQEACIGLVNYGETSLNLSGTSGGNSQFSLGNLPGSLGSMQNYCLTVSANSSQAFAPVALTIQSSSHPDRTIYIASTGSNSNPGITPPALDGLSLDSLGVSSALLGIDKSNAGYTTQWTGTLVFIARHPFQQFWSHNTPEAALYTADAVWGNGSAASADGVNSAYCVYNSSNSTDEQLLISGLQANTRYYVQAFHYLPVNGQNDLFSAASNASTRTRDTSSTGQTGNCDGSLIISEYVEGSSFNKCIEITNASEQSIDLADYQLLLNSNANSTPQASLTLMGTLPAQESYVICHGSAASAFLTRADQTSSSVINFNGDDLISLIEIATGDTLDRMGSNLQLGANHTIVDNGVTHFIKDVTLVRADSVRIAGKPWSKTRLQWHALPNNTADSLGSHHLEVCVTASVESPYNYMPFGDRFGESVALSDGFAAVGSPGRAGQYAEAFDTLQINGPFAEMGAIYLFKKMNNAWREWQRVEAPDRDGDDLFGASLLINDSVLVVGAQGESGRGKTYIFERNALDQWIFNAELLPNGNLDSAFGAALSMADGMLAIGAPLGKGAVGLFAKSGGQWVNQTWLQAASDGAEFGFSLHLHHDTLLIGAPAQDGGGAVWIYHHNGGTQWNLLSVLQAPDANTGRRFGHSVHRMGSQIFVGDPVSNQVYCFSQSANSWGYLQSLQPMTAQDGDYFGASLSGENGSLHIGAEGVAHEAGRVFVFEQIAGQWMQNALFWAVDSSMNSRFGHALVRQGNEMLIGAPMQGPTVYRASSVSRGAAYFVDATSGAIVPLVVRGEGEMEAAYNPAVNLLLRDAKLGDDLLIYPNPNNGTFWVTGPSGWKLKCFNAHGQLIAAFSAEEDQPSIPIALPTTSAGVYLLQFSLPDGRVLQTKVMVEGR